MTLYDLEYKIKGVPKWKVIGIAALVLFAASYLVWSFVHTPSPKAGAVILPAPAITVPKVEGPTLKVPLKVVPPKAVEKKFPTIGTTPPDKPVIDTAKIPQTENGGSTVTSLDLVTGEASTVFVPDPAPWFAFEDKNAVGIAYLWTSQGTTGAAYYRRDLFRVKDIHVTGIAGIMAVDGRVGVGAGVTGELRF